MPNENHVKVVKRIFRYLKAIIDFGLWYPRSENLNLTTYTNIDWAWSIDDQKSTHSGSFFLGDSLVSWLNKKHDLVPLSIEEVEYIAITSYCTQILWMKKNLNEMNIEIDESIYVDFEDLHTL